MPRFYFDTRFGDELHQDTVGEEYADVEAAIFVAKLEAADFVAAKIAHGECVDGQERLVRNDRGEVVARFMIIDALGSPIPRHH